MEQLKGLKTVSVSSHTWNPISIFSREGLRRFTQEIVVLDRTLALALPHFAFHFSWRNHSPIVLHRNWLRSQECSCPSQNSPALHSLYHIRVHHSSLHFIFWLFVSIHITFPNNESTDITVKSKTFETYCLKRWFLNRIPRVIVE